ncbi:MULTISPECIES: hypothetical protein [unclassified Sphingomonas]|uniref:hypothetical protein n=1 Tax=unclassified Sphingomonas TaxID=196159 RepID=UPI002150DE03|nr:MULTISPECIES: hypothetical protein [unclassified Sphingomonas]MCR5870655.1 hypothetical protein [Sphingomonas sp. J344]UUY01007.1 hypothetical protein LRS08_08110 [Sphingomonas sp. J315]
MSTVLAERLGVRLTQDGTEGRVYGGDPNLIHVPDGKRADLGKALATDLDHLMRVGARGRTLHQASTQPLCPGCYMIVGFDMLVTLADRNGQSRTELANSMIRAFEHLRDNPEGPGLVEEIAVVLDPEEESV